MDFYKEAADLRKMWVERSFIGKAILLFSFAMSIMSVGSLASNVFEFKGFLLNGIDFYTKVTAPLREYISDFFNINVPITMQDSIVLFIIIFGGVIRFDAQEFNRDGWLWVIGLLVYYFILVILGMLGIQCGLEPTLLIFSVSLLMPTIYALTCNKKFKISPKERLLTLYIIGIYFTVAVIAAISEGLSRAI